MDKLVATVVTERGVMGDWRLRLSAKALADLNLKETDQVGLYLHEDGMIELKRIARGNFDDDNCPINLEEFGTIE